MDTAGSVFQPRRSFWGHVNILICSGWKSHKTCGPVLHQRLTELGSACVFGPSRRCVTAASVCGLLVLSSFLMCLGIIGNILTAACRLVSWTRGKRTRGAPLLHLPLNICKRTNGKILVYVNNNTHTHMQSGLPLPQVIYEGHKDIIALVTYGVSEVPHAESCSCLVVSCCPLCCRRPRAIEGNTWAVFHDASFGEGGRGVGGTRTWAAVLLMGHLDVWAYVIQSQRAASNRPPIAGIQLRDDRSAASLLQLGGRGSGNRSRQGPEVSLSPSTSPSPNAHTHIYTHTVLSHSPFNSWPDLDVPLENPAEALCSCVLRTQTEA